MSIPTLDIDALTVRIGDTCVLDGASLSAAAGEVVAIVGPNGAGKTTLLETIVGLRRARAGRITFGGQPLVSFRERAAVFAYMPDEAALPEEVDVDTLLAAQQRDTSRRQDVIRRYALEPLLDRGGRELSRGEAKRVWLAMTALLDRPVAVLDEPFGAFDPLQLDELLPTVRGSLGARGLVLVTIHQMTTAERLADRVVMLAAGRIVAEGTIDALRSQAGLARAPLEDVFRVLLSKSRLPTNGEPNAST